MVARQFQNDRSCGPAYDVNSGPLRRLPVCSAAYADGVLSGGQVEAIVACLDDATAELFADYEAELVPYLTP